MDHLSQIHHPKPKPQTLNSQAPSWRPSGRSGTLFLDSLNSFSFSCKLLIKSQESVVLIFSSLLYRKLIYYSKPKERFMENSPGLLSLGPKDATNNGPHPQKHRFSYYIKYCSKRDPFKENDRQNYESELTEENLRRQIIKRHHSSKASFQPNYLWAKDKLISIHHRIVQMTRCMQILRKQVNLTRRRYHSLRNILSATWKESHGLLKASRGSPLYAPSIFLF